MKQFFLLILLIISTTAFSQNTDKVVKQRLDGIIIKDINFNSHEKTIFLYDENEIQCIEYSWNPRINDWKEFCKYEYKYDSNKNIITAIVQNFSEYLIKEMFYYPLAKNEYAYDSKGNLTIDINYRWNYTNNDWKELYKSEYVYDKNDNPILYCDDLGSYNIKYKYDNNGNKTEEVHYGWSTMSKIWVKHFKREYMYDKNGNITREASHHWFCRSNTNKFWEKDVEYEYIYDSFGNQIEEIISRRGKKNIWKKSTKKESIYDSNRNLIEEIHYSIKNNTWQENRKMEYVYDSNQNLIKMICYGRENNTWETTRKTEWVYDTLYFQENVIYPLTIHYYDIYDIWKVNTYKSYNMLIEKNEYSWESKEWEFNRSKKFYYSPQIIEEKTLTTGRNDGENLINNK